MPKSKRKVSASEKRELIMSSKAYKDWWAARRRMGSVPLDPYRAFMIDLSLRARRERKADWKKQPNRMDYQTIDYPVPHGGRPTVPSRTPRKSKGKKGKTRRRTRRRKPEFIPKKPKQSPIQREFTKIAERFSKKYNVPVPRVFVGDVPHSKSYYKTGVGFYSAGIGKRQAFRSSEPMVFVGYKGKKSKVESEAALLHELGHHVDLWQKMEQTGSLSREVVGSQLEKEIRATRLAKPLFTKPKKQAWLLRHYLSTYMHRTRTELTPTGKTIHFGERRRRR